MSKRIAVFLSVLLMLAVIAPAVGLGEAAAPAGSLPGVVIGKADQPIGDITIAENAAGVLSGTVTYSTAIGASGMTSPIDTDSASVLRLLLPPGVTFTSTPAVAVASGDLEIGAVACGQLPGDQGYLDIRIRSSSTVPSVIVVSGVRLTLDRTVPAGQIILRIRGTAVDQTLLPPDALFADPEQENSLFPNAKDAAALPVAVCATPAPAVAQSAVVSVFRMGDQNFTLNGTGATLDAAPYIKDGRVMVPLRALVEAVGAPDAGIVWDGAGNVIVNRNGRVIRLTIGSKLLQINGANISMDVAPEIVSGWTMAPLSWIAQALGLSAVWDRAARTVTVTGTA
jgi:hypothetical protein